VNDTRNLMPPATPFPPWATKVVGKLSDGFWLI
jgi:hypothetical protein